MKNKLFFACYMSGLRNRVMLYSPSTRRLAVVTLSPSTRRKLLKHPLVQFLREERSGDPVTSRLRRRDLDSEIRRRTDAIAKSGRSHSLLGALAERQADLKQIERRWKLVLRPRQHWDAAAVRKAVEEDINGLAALLRLDVMRAKTE